MTDAIPASAVHQLRLQVLLLAGGGRKRHLRSASIPDALMRQSRSAAASAAGSDSEASTFGGYASADGDVADESRHGLPPLARSKSRWGVKNQKVSVCTF